jgi:hypothetical protein
MGNQAGEKNLDVTTVNGVTELEVQVQCRLSGQIHDLRLVVEGSGWSCGATPTRIT